MPCDCSCRYSKVKLLLRQQVFTETGCTRQRNHLLRLAHNTETKKDSPHLQFCILAIARQRKIIEEIPMSSEARIRGFQCNRPIKKRIPIHSLATIFRQKNGEAGATAKRRRKIPRQHKPLVQRQGHRAPRVASRAQENKGGKN